MVYILQFKWSTDRDDRFLAREVSGNPIYSGVGQIQLDWSSVSWLTVMTSLTCSIRIFASPPCGSSSSPAYRGSTLVKIMPSSLSHLISIRLSHLWHLLLPRLGFSTKPHWHCLHFTRVCGLCHQPPLSNSGNVSGHHLAGSNMAGCWLSFVSFSSVRPTYLCRFGLEEHINNESTFKQQIYEWVDRSPLRAPTVPPRVPHTTTTVVPIHKRVVYMHGISPTGVDWKWVTTITAVMIFNDTVGLDVLVMRPNPVLDWVSSHTPQGVWPCKLPIDG